MILLILLLLRVTKRSKYRTPHFLMSKHVFLVFVTRIKNKFNWFDSETRELCKVWLSKLESLIRELNIYFVNCGLDRVTIFKYFFFFVHYSFVWYLFSYFWWPQFWSYTGESLVFLVWFVFAKTRELFFKYEYYFILLASQSSFIVSLDWTANLHFHFK